MDHCIIDMKHVTLSTLPDKTKKEKCPTRKLRDSKRLFTFILNKKRCEMIHFKKEIESFHSEKIEEVLFKQKEHYVSRHNYIVQKLNIRHKSKLQETIESCTREFRKENNIIQNKLFQCERENVILKEKVQEKLFSSITGNE